MERQAFCHFIRMIIKYQVIIYVLILVLNYKEAFTQLWTTLEKFINDKFGKEAPKNVGNFLVLLVPVRLLLILKTWEQIYWCI